MPSFRALVPDPPLVVVPAGALFLGLIAPGGDELRHSGYRRAPVSRPRLGAAEDVRTGETGLALTFDDKAEFPSSDQGFEADRFAVFAEARGGPRLIVGRLDGGTRRIDPFLSACFRPGDLVVFLRGETPEDGFLLTADTAPRRIAAPT